MHMRGEPNTMQSIPPSADICREWTFGRKKRLRAKKLGVSSDQILLDRVSASENGRPEFRTAAQSGPVGAAASLLVGTSRKSFIGSIIKPAGDCFSDLRYRGASIMLGAHVVRVHDVAAVREVADVTDVIVRTQEPDDPDKAVAICYSRTCHVRPENKNPCGNNSVRGRLRSVAECCFTNGCFDILHVGHIRYLNAARDLGDALVVGINSDRSVRGIKGESRPIVPEAERAEVLAALACVDFVCIFDDPTPKQVIDAIVPDVLVKGADWGISEIGVETL
jgi:rfaE bifunctional protein nucleotidyltransferase chain/domain